MKNIDRNWVYTRKFIEEKIYIITNRLCYTLSIIIARREICDLFFPLPIT